MKVAERNPSTPPAALRLPSPAELRAEWPISAVAESRIARTREAIGRILTGDDARLLVIVGPCSIHDADAALEYARWLQSINDGYADRLLIVMRAYVEKARTRLGWKGLLHDPRLDGSARIDEGVRMARQLLVAINELGVPVATEVLDPFAAACLGDTLSWAAIGARTSESPAHRELAAWLRCPVGFKNTTAGSVAVAINAVVAARPPQRVMGIDVDGRAAMFETTGNADAHIILRGGGGQTNYDSVSIEHAAEALSAQGLPDRLIVDCSHGNSRGDFRNQVTVAAEIGRQLAGGSTAIAGIMLESHLVEGRQSPAPNGAMLAGQSITDGCLGLAETVEVLDRLAEAHRASS